VADREGRERRAVETAGNDMNERKRWWLRVCFTAIVACAELALLGWEHLHGGVKTHHILQSAALPGFSNCWGLLLLPSLTWFLTGRIQRRISLEFYERATASTIPAIVIAGFVGALAFGVSLSVAFQGGYDDTASYLFMGVLLLAVLLPLFRAECVLGFVLGMTVTFGAVVPTLISTIIAAISASVFFYVRPVLTRLWALSKRA
jgi:hypothetical protein